LLVPGWQTLPAQQPLAQLIALQAAWQTPFRQMPLRQSRFTKQVWPFAQGGQTGPPQSTSVSLPFLMPSLQVTVVAQVPLVQAWPVAQAGPLPHTHIPLAQLSALVPQEVHTAPLVPHPVALGVMQTLPEQQPLGQLALLHTQAPPWQRWPAEHAGLVPHVQAPLVQLSARVTLQATQAAPFVPQAVIEGLVQIPLRQHPRGQLVPLQVQEPFTHTSPAGQAAPLPQAQAPLLQLSDVAESQVEQTPPFAPQAVVVLPGWHAPPTQQPFGQLLALQAQDPFTHAWPAAQRLPQAPQLAVSLVRLASQPSAAALLQSPNPGEQVMWQVPPTQLAVPLVVLQTLPQAPQLLVSVAVLKQSPPQAVCVGGQEVWQVPPLQTFPLGQAWLHWPQLPESAARFTHLPPQSVSPLVQEQAPFEQICPLGQAWPQAPQLLASEERLAQQLSWPGLQAPLWSPLLVVEAA
jgi:hypothetical protein